MTANLVSQSTVVCSNSADFSARCRVEFADTDMAGIAHFTNYFHYMERVEHEFLRACGLDVVLHDQRGAYGFPKRSVECDYFRPARHGAELEASLRADWSDGKSIRYEIEFSCDGQLHARGRLQVACCRFPVGGDPFAIPLPDHVLSGLQRLAAGQE